MSNEINLPAPVPLVFAKHLSNNCPKSLRHILPNQFLIKKRYYVTYLFNFYPFLLSGCIIIRMTTQRLDLRPMGPMRYIINEQRLKEKVDVIAKYLEEMTTKILINDLLKLKNV
uniref:Uncharacterized protein n=1 Tax=Glossina palpalis gambiensis TaxID=67801 RepID=A0A1B0APF0_9MUSC